MSKNQKSEKVAALTLVIAILAVGVSLFTYLQVATGAGGFSGPSDDPPPVGSAEGILRASGTNLGVGISDPLYPLTVNGIISASNNRVIEVAEPVDGTDAVNLDYLDLQLAAAAGGSGGVFYLTCGWEMDDAGGPNGTGTITPPQKSSCLSSLPDCVDFGATMLDQQDWVTTSDFELLEFTPASYKWQTAGVSQRVCQVQ